MSARFRFVLLVIALFPLTASADPIDALVSGVIISVKDNKTQEPYVLQTHKVRVTSRLVLEVRGYTNGSLRNWLSSKLPPRLQAYFEREDLESGLVTRFRPLPFRLQTGSISCRRDDAPEFRVCKAEYAVSRSNAVDIPPGEGGKQAMTLQVLTPKGIDFPVKIARARPRIYSVLTGKPQLSLRKFVGLPEH